MKQFWATFGGQIAGYAAALAVVGVVLYMAWRKLFGSQTPTQLLDNVTTSAEQIPAGLASLAGSVIRGESADGYISPQEFAARKAAVDARLAAQQGGL